MNRLIRSEILKIRTTNTWWLLGLGTLVMTAFALLVNCIQAHFLLRPFDEFVKSTSGGRTPDQIPPGQLAEMKAQWASQHDVVAQAANIFTSGQFFGVLIVSVLGILLITNEYYHQTATTTFLTTPHRTRVVLAKLVTGVLASAIFWLFTLVVNVVVGTIFLKTEGFGSHLGDWEVSRALLLNLAAYAIWAVFGVGFGALIRSQIGATITATVLYLIGTTAAQLLFMVVHQFVIKKDWVLTAQVIVPSIASSIMISPTKTFPQSPPQWVGALVLIGYGAVAGIIGTLILRKRDVS
ncbi:ABC transporter permease [Planosporangium sp. 12N6]|uniref:ABC transporter permease n=1 Tax=Planosporangium spinosum TaxID=3402278 RepID=UPI003CF7FA5D